MENKLIKYRWWIIGASLALTVAFSLSLIKLQVEPDLKKYFSDSMPSMKNTSRIEEIFGNQDIIMVVFEAEDILEAASLKRIKAVEREVKRLSGVRSTASLFGSNHIYSEDGVMYVDPAIRRIPASRADRERLREDLAENPLVYEMFVSKDFKAAAMVCALDDDVDEEEILAGIEQVVLDIPGEEKIHIGGMPYLRRSIRSDVQRDGLIMVPLALLFMLIFLFFSFKEARGVFLPFLVVIFSSLLGLSLIPILGWHFYLITLLAPVLLIAVANDYGIHMMAAYQEEASGNKSLSMPELAIRITQRLWKPILLTGLTTMAGISALMAHSMIPARQMALVAGIGIMMAVVYSLLLLPAILSLLPRPKSFPAERDNNTPGALSRLSARILRHYRIIPPLVMGLTLLLSMGIFRLQVDSNEENFFPDNHPVKQASNIINKYFGGSESISLLFSGDMLDPEILERMEYYREEMEKLEAVDQTMGFSAVIREISKALNDPGDPWYDCIPPRRDAVAQYMELYSMNADPEELEQLVDFNYSHAQLMIRINAANTETVRSIINHLEELSMNDSSVELIGGYSFVRSELATKVVSGTYRSLGLALLIIFLLLALIFRSLWAGVLGMVPLFISQLCLFGLMGLTGIPLDIATALLSSVMLGIGIDYSIHFLWRYRSLRKNHLKTRDAIKCALQTTGRGIVINALSVIIGFSVLIFSSFTPIRFFGVLVVISIFTCLVGALVILPAVVMRFKFSFLEPEGEVVVIPVKRGRRERAGFRPRPGIALRRVAMSIILLFITGLLAGQSSPEKARDLVERSHEVLKVSAYEGQSTLIITDAKGRQRIRESRMSSMSFPDGTEKRLIRFHAPAEVRGTGILIYDYKEKGDDMWIYLPALRKTRRIVSREKSKSFMGSEFSNANLSAPALDDFTYLVSGSEMYEGKKMLLLESRPVDMDKEDEYGFSRTVSWMDDNNYLVYRIDYYDMDGTLFKTITNEKFEPITNEKGKFMVTEMKAQNLENERHSEMLIRDLRFVEIDPSIYSVANLERE